MTLRLSEGLASGLDIESMISAIIEAESTKATIWEEEIEEMEDEYTAWTEIDTYLTELSDITDELTSYTTWEQMETTVSDSSVLSSVSAEYTALEDTYSITVTQLATADQYTSNSQDSSTEALGYEGTFTINGVEITVESDDTLEDISDAINEAATDMEDEVQAQIIGTTLVIRSSDSGTGNEMTITDGSEGILEDLGVLDNHTEAQDLEATIDGIAVTSKTNSGIEDFIAGVTMEFTETGTTTLTVDHDTENLKTLITDFIDKYNEVVEYMTECNTVYLTNTEDSDGGDVSATGVLQGDYLLQSILNKFRSIVTTTNTDPTQLDQDFNNLYSIGIWTTGEDNQLELVDEDKLDDALENNFDEVEDLFRQTDTVDGELVYVGVLKQLDEYLYSLTDSTEGSVTSRQTSLIEDVEEREEWIEELEAKMEERETQLYEHYSAMEEVTADITSQLEYLLETLGTSSD